MNYLKSAKGLDHTTVLVRVDMNEPIDSRGQLADDFRIQAIVPTIRFLLERHCRVIVAAHLGRPEGKWDKQFSLHPIAQRLAELLGLKYDGPQFLFYKGDITTPENETLSFRDMPEGSVVMLENLRFYEGEEKNSAEFAKQLASLADNYVNDAFAVCHRKDASIVAITKYLPSYAGLLLEQEIKNLDYVLKKPLKPFMVMMGGIKISDKEKTLQHLATHADTILLGGGLANILLQAQGMEIGESVVEKEGAHLAAQLLRNFKHKLVLPKDLVVAHKSMARETIRVSSVHGVHKNEMILDIGPQTILEYAKLLKTAKTIVWNGPLGYFEHKPFDTATMALARVVGGISKGHCFSVVGGGETVDAVRLAHQQHFIDHLSTGGGAMLEFLSGDKLPGLEALK